MDKHKFRLTWIFIGYGFIGLMVSAFTLPLIVSAFGESNALLFGSSELTNMQMIMLGIAVMQLAIVLVAGIIATATRSVSHPIFFFAGLFILISFPIGTIIMNNIH